MHLQCYSYQSYTRIKLDTVFTYNIHNLRLAVSLTVRSPRLRYAVNVRNSLVLQVIILLVIGTGKTKILHMGVMALSVFFNRKLSQMVLVLL